MSINRNSTPGLDHSPRKIVFLYLELAGYTLACLRKLCEIHPVEAHVMRYEVNAEAPFEFDAIPGVTFHNRQKSDQDQPLNLLREVDPDLVVCAGWMDKGYIRAVRKWKHRGQAVLVFDNKWENNLKQRALLQAGKWLMARFFDAAWVPWERQREFASKLGFAQDRINLDFYCADSDLFEGMYGRTLPVKQEAYPRKFLYIGRYVEHKGIYDMWNAFAELQAESPNEWELICAGTGELYDQRVEHPGIRHEGFVQPSDLERYIQEAGVLILPSHFEPWGVVVHEFALAGLPMICSKEVGAADRFIEPDGNGIVFTPGNVEELKQAMKRMVNHTDAELMAMSKRSAELGKQVNTSQWADQLMMLLENGHVRN